MPTTLLRHLSQAWRALSRRPTAALATVATIALVSGAGTAVLTVANAAVGRRDSARQACDRWRRRVVGMRFTLRPRCPAMPIERWRRLMHPMHRDAVQL